MARKPIEKKLEGARLLKDYASWVYCEGCGKTLAYLCYVTYQRFDFRFTCACGHQGSVSIAFEEAEPAQESNAALTLIKNRLCCPEDGSPLLSLVEKHLADYQYSITCTQCHHRYGG